MLIQARVAASDPPFPAVAFLRASDGATRARREPTPHRCIPDQRNGPREYGRSYLAAFLLELLAFRKSASS